MSFAKIIKELRESKGYSQEELAHLLETKRSNIANWETRGEPDYATLKKLATFFNVTVDYLLGLTEEPKSNGDMNFILKTGMNVNELVKMMDMLDAEDQGKIIKAIMGLNAMIELNKKTEGNK